MFAVAARSHSRCNSSTCWWAVRAQACPASGDQSRMGLSCFLHALAAFGPQHCHAHRTLLLDHDGQQDGRLLAGAGPLPRQLLRRPPLAIINHTIHCVHNRWKADHGYNAQVEAFRTRTPWHWQSITAWPPARKGCIIDRAIWRYAPRAQGCRCLGVAGHGQSGRSCSDDPTRYTPWRRRRARQWVRNCCGLQAASAPSASGA